MYYAKRYTMRNVQLIAALSGLVIGRLRYCVRASRGFPNRKHLGLIAERLSARELILRRISEIVGMYVCMYMYPSRLGIQLFRALATRKRSITCASVTLRNITAVLPAIEVRGEKSSAYNYSAGRRRRCTHTTQWRPA